MFILSISLLGMIVIFIFRPDFWSILVVTVHWDCPNPECGWIDDSV